MPSLPRVLFVAPFGLRQKTTVWARTLPLARELVALGHEVTILIPPWDSPQDSGTRWLDAGVEVVNAKTSGGLPAILPRLLYELDLRSPQIVHIVKPRAHAGLLQWILWQRRRVRGAGPALLLDLDDWEQAWAPINHYPAPLARFLAWQEEWGIRHADGITAASRWLVNRAHDYTHLPEILYLPNGVNPIAALPSAALLPAGPPTVLFFTRYVEVEPLWLAEMASALLAAHPDVRLVIAGHPLRPDGDRAFRSAFAACGLEGDPRVMWVGSVDPATVPGLLAASHLAIFPADPTPLQEAKCSVRLATTLLNGVPVVAAAVGEQANYGAGGAARLVPAGAAPAEFAAAVRETLADPQARLEMVQRARVHLSQAYQWRDLGGQLSRYYATFMGEAGAGT